MGEISSAGYGELKSYLRTLDLKAVDLIQSAAESRLDAQLTVTLSADGRANAFMAFAATLCAGALGGFISADAIAIRAFSFAVALGFLPCCIYAYRACAPREIYLKGHRPSDWLSSEVDKNCVLCQRINLIMQYQETIEKNRLMMAKREGHMNRAAILLLATVSLASLAAIFLWS